MASYVSLVLDTTAPGGVAVVVNSGDAYTASLDVSVAISSTDGDLTGYTCKIYGDVDDSFAQSSYRAVEGNAPWIALSGSPFSVRLASGNGSKTVRVKVRDDVNNPSSEATDAITVDTTLNVVTVTTGLSVTKVSKQTGKRTATFIWESDATFDEYKVKVVPATNSIHSAGTTLLTTNGSSNVSGSAGSYPATTGITTTIDGEDLEVASAGDGTKIIKVFVREVSGNWST